jgi:hypothetical protein
LPPPSPWKKMREIKAKSISRSFLLICTSEHLLYDGDSARSDSRACTIWMYVSPLVGYRVVIIRHTDLPSSSAVFVAVSHAEAMSGKISFIRLTISAVATTDSFVARRSAASSFFACACNFEDGYSAERSTRHSGHNCGWIFHRQSRHITCIHGVTTRIVDARTSKHTGHSSLVIRSSTRFGNMSYFYFSTPSVGLLRFDFFRTLGQFKTCM